MDFYGLQAFVYVEKTRSFSKAAELLLLTQPAVSKRIQSLEQELGVRLFDRIGKKILLTPSGQELHKRAQSILNELEDCHRAIQNLTDRVTGTLSFGTSHHIGLHRLPPLLREFTKVYPEVDLDIHFMDSERAIGSLNEATIEFGLATLPDSCPKGLLMSPVWPEQLLPVAAKNHKLATWNYTDRKIPVTEMTLHPAILPGPTTYTRELIDEQFASRGAELNVKLSTNYLETIMMLISVGLGWGFLPQSMVLAKRSELHPLDIEGITVSRKLGIISHKKRTLSIAARALLDMLDQHPSGIESC